MEVSTLKNFQNNTGSFYTHFKAILEGLLMGFIVLMMKSPKQAEGSKKCEN